MTAENTPTQDGTASPSSATVATVAEMIRVFYEGLGPLPMALKEQLTRDFAAEINKAMGVRIAQGSGQSGAQTPESVTRRHGLPGYHRGGLTNRRPDDAQAAVLCAGCSWGRSFRV